MYEGIQSELINTTRFDENSDFSMACLLEKVTNFVCIHIIHHILEKMLTFSLRPDETATVWWL